MNVKLIKGHDGPEIEEREVEVVLEQFQDVVIPIFALAVLQSEAHAPHYSEPATSVEENVTQLKVPLHEINLRQEKQRTTESPFLPFHPKKGSFPTSWPHLPGHKGLALECGEGAEACGEAKPADFHQGDAVEEDAVGQDEGDVGPAHAGPHSQEAVHQVHQRPVLEQEQEMLAFVLRELYLI